jgi:uncharacterized NAD(P)/FAD-binding protein YdhS
MKTAASNPPHTQFTVAIVGGGFTGAAVAYHLAQCPALYHAAILVFEPRDALGKGLAYDTADTAHRINVPAARMSLLPDDPEHFARWLAETGGLGNDPDAHRADGNIFPKRGVFGEYVSTQVKPFIDAGRIGHVRSRVAHVLRLATGWQLEVETGNSFTADILVIATTHPAPRAPASLSTSLAGHPRYIADATKPDALDHVRPEHSVLIVGNGLTAADVIASLSERGHVGKILAVSRRGLRSRGHAAFPQEPYGDFVSPPPQSARELLQRTRLALRDAEGDGLSWHAVLDQLRAQARPIWQGLTVVERRRLVRHLRVYWDVHRFRIAPQVEQALDDATTEGRLEIAAGSILSARRHGDGMQVIIRRRGGATEALDFDAVVVTTGPAHGGILSSQSWLSELAEAGRLTMDPTGLGLACNENGEALDMEGDAQPCLLIAGPLARGVFGELMGLPQVSEYAKAIAKRVTETIAGMDSQAGASNPSTVSTIQKESSRLGLKLE